MVRHAGLDGERAGTAAQSSGPDRDGARRLANHDVSVEITAAPARRTRLNARRKIPVGHCDTSSRSSASRAMVADLGLLRDRDQKSRCRVSPFAHSRAETLSHGHLAGQRTRCRTLTISIAFRKLARGFISQASYNAQPRERRPVELTNAARINMYAGSRQEVFRLPAAGGTGNGASMASDRPDRGGTRDG